jgi:hypothetical protein
MSKASATRLFPENREDVLFLIEYGMTRRYLNIGAVIHQVVSLPFCIKVSEP